MSPQRDPQVQAAVAASREVLQTNKQLLKEVAALEQAIARQEWKRRHSAK